MAKALEAWEFRNPLEVAERRELQANAKAARQTEKLNERLAKSAEQERIRAKVFKKGWAT